MKVMTRQARTAVNTNTGFTKGHIYVSRDDYTRGIMTNPFHVAVCGQGKLLSQLVTGNTAYDTGQQEPHAWVDVTDQFELREVDHA